MPGLLILVVHISNIHKLMKYEVMGSNSERYTILVLSSNPERDNMLVLDSNPGWDIILVLGSNSEFNNFSHGFEFQV